MAPNVVLVTGVGDHVAARLASRLASDSRTDRVIGVDSRPAAAGLSDEVEYAGVDIRSPVIARVLRAARVDTVVHAVPRAGGAAGRERAIVGTMQLLAGCQRAGTVRKLVVRSTADVYGAGPTSPAVFTEQDVPGAGRPRDAVEIEEYVQRFARRSPETTVTVVRLAELLGSGADSALARYFALPVVPTVLGFDPRVQLLHHQDAVSVLHRAATLELPGVFNVGGDGVLLLSQAVRRAGRVALPMPRAAVPTAARLARTELSPDLTRLLNYGRVIDTTRLKTTFGFTPRWSTTAAFDDYVRTRRRR